MSARESWDAIDPPNGFQGHTDPNGGPEAEMIEVPNLFPVPNLTANVERRATKKVTQQQADQNRDPNMVGPVWEPSLQREQGSHLEPRV